MVFPIMISMMEEALSSVPDGLREATLASGVTRWLMVRKVDLRRALPGVISAVVLGFSRAFGETMAVFFQLATPVKGVQERAYASALVLTAIVFLISVLSRVASA
jgi:ABC-type phosphate transport system permease subunit